MKMLHFLYFILVFSTNLSLAQSRFPLIANSKWNMFLKESNWICSPEEQDEYYSMFFIGDTLINSVKYFKLFKSGVAYFEKPFYYKNLYMGALRDFDNKFYFIEKNKSEELLLYDFTRSIDDTIYTGVKQQFSIIFKIDTLDDRRKTFTCRTIYEWGGKCTIGYIIEGIGGIGGLLNDMPCDHPGLREHFLICYSEGDSTLFNSHLTNCPCNSEADTVSNFSNSLTYNYKTTVYPNPSYGLFNIRFEESGFLEYNVVGISGSSFLKGKITKETNQLDLQRFKKGIYILKLTDHIKSSSHKIVIQ